MQEGINGGMMADAVMLSVGSLVRNCVLIFEICVRD
jgi:hypothetical protein